MRVSNTGRRPREPENYKTSLNGINNSSNESSVQGINRKGQTILERELGESAVQQKPQSEVKVETTNSAMASVKGSPPTAEGKAQSNQGNKTKEKGKKPKKEKPKKTKAERTLPKLSGGRIFLMTLTGILSSAALGVLTYGLYMNQIKYPSQMVIDDSSTGSYCLRNWEQTIRNLDSNISKFMGTDTSYLEQEIEYANDDEVRIAFLKKIAQTVEYIPKQTEALNKYGNLMVDRNDEVVYMDSDVKVGEEITLSYVDYSKIKLDKEKIQELMEAEKLAVGDVDYSVKLIDVFCKYITDIEELPIKQDSKYIPNLALGKGNKYVITKEEDIVIDKLLFSSEEFFELLDKFSIMAGGSGAENPDWVAWNSLSEEEKKKQDEPSKTLEELQPTAEWVTWNNLERDEQKKQEEPPKYSSKGLIDKTWCGTYYLQNEYTEVDANGNVINVAVGAMKGDGSQEDPAGMNTDVITYVLLDEPEEGETPQEEEASADTEATENKEEVSETSKPIKIRMTEFGVSKDAVDWFESKDVRNRGIDINSEVQYCYYVFEVTNMSDTELTINDNSSLCDVNANLHSRTGEIFGLTDSVTLKPDETGIIESWGMSTSLNKQYVIWGADFARRESPVWFRVLMGDLEDETEEKGVLINDTRGIGEVEGADMAE